MFLLCMLSHATITKTFDITEEQFNNILDELRNVNEKILNLNQELKNERKLNVEMNNDLSEMRKEIIACKSIETQLASFKAKKYTYNTSDLEERVLVLELEVSSLQAALVEVDQDVDNLETDQSIQDERMNDLEDEVNSLEHGYVDLLVRVDTNEEDIVLHREQINVLENDIDLVEADVTMLDERITQLESSDEKFNDRLGELEMFANLTKNQDLDSRVDSLEAISSSHHDVLAALETNTTLLGVEVLELQGSVAENILEITDINSEIDVLQNIVGEDAIGFHAILNDLTPYPGQIVAYGNVRLNLGNHYNSSSGIFTVPRAGLYHFSMHVRHARYGGDVDKFMIQLNGANQCSGATDSESTSQLYDDSSCNVLLYLSVGDTVNVYAYTNADSELYENISNYFNGFFIRGP